MLSRRATQPGTVPFTLIMMPTCSLSSQYMSPAFLTIQLLLLYGDGIGTIRDNFALHPWLEPP